MHSCCQSTRASRPCSRTSSGIPTRPVSWAWEPSAFGYDRRIMSTASDPKVSKAGLEDVVATSSGICFIDGDRGVLAYRGYDIHDLATHATFEEVCYLLWHGRLPTRAELGELQSQFAAARPAARGRRAAAAVAAARPTAMDLLRTLASALAHYDADAADNSPAANYRKAVTAHGAVGQPRRHPRPVRGGRRTDPAGRRPWGSRRAFSTCSPGQRPDALSTRAFDVALVLHADHELNASTFAARVAAATLTDVHSAVVGGHRHAEGAAARRRERGGDEDAARSGRRRDAREDREHGAREARPEGEDSGLRPSRLPHDGSARGAPSPDVARPREAHRPAAVVRDVGAHRERS